jgi:hypothetical protein
MPDNYPHCRKCILQRAVYDVAIETPLDYAPVHFAASGQLVLY